MYCPGTTPLVAACKGATAQEDREKQEARSAKFMNILSENLSGGFDDDDECNS
jgi:hypothetical protein